LPRDELSAVNQNPKAPAGVQDRKTAKHGQSRAVPKEVHHRQANERDRKDRGENRRTDPNEQLDDAKLLLVKFERKQFEPIPGGI
jgi:hypothetical protein